MVTRRNMMLGAGAAAIAGTAAYASLSGPSYGDMADAVWVPRKSAADTDLEYLVHYARLAANSHNTQPWLFGRSGDQVLIKPDLGRQTPIVDPDGHHLHASLGCACENLMLAAAAAGKGADMTFRDGADAHIEIDVSSPSRQAAPLFDTILHRQCTRSEYDGRAVSADDVTLLEQAARVEGAQVLMIDDKARIEQALDLVIAANTAQIEDPRFVAELKSWIRFNAAQAADHHDGLFTGCTGNPALPAWLGNLAFGLLFKTGPENDKLARQIRSSSGLAIFVSDRDDKEHWVQAGRSYQRFALQATALGIKHAFINQPVEVGKMRPDFADWLGIDGRRPDLVVRYGYAPAMPRSLRRPVADVIVQ